eukprot:1782834-Rhodomonas_salina.1
MACWLGPESVRASAGAGVGGQVHGPGAGVFVPLRLALLCPPPAPRRPRRPRPRLPPLSSPLPYPPSHHHRPLRTLCHSLVLSCSRALVSLDASTRREEASSLPQALPPSGAGGNAGEGGGGV